MRLGVSQPSGVSLSVPGAQFFTVLTPFAAQLDLTMLPSGAIEIDDFGRTSRPGVWAAGDLAHRASLPGAMASVLAAASAGQLAAAAIVQELAG
jgi:thioredoxin reductase